MSQRPVILLTELDRYRKFSPEFERVVGELNLLTIIQRDRAFSHFLGGAGYDVEQLGAVGRAEFIRLLAAAHKYALGVWVIGCLGICL